MATFLTKREAQQKAKEEKEQKRQDKLHYSDLMWAAKRRYLDDREWYEMHKLHMTYGTWGPERSEYEFGILEEMRKFFARHEVGSKAPELNALEKHLAMHAEKQERQEKEKNKKIVPAHPSEKLLKK